MFYLHNHVCAIRKENQGLKKIEIKNIKFINETRHYLQQQNKML